MCGIAGWVEPGSDAGVSIGDMRAMIARIRHRGPDEAGVHVEPGVGLAHARLSIVDLEGGKQPMSNRDGSVWVVYNGEVYNHVELRAELEGAGYAFRTRSDTEVVLAAYEVWGLEAVHRYNGQFALALWDRRRARLVLFRDRVGVRPLFYRREGTALRFASEIKALFAAGGARPRLAPEGIAEAFCFWAPLDPRTAFEGVESLPPGHLLVFDREGLCVRPYWDWRFSPETARRHRPLEACAGELRETLVDAVRIRLRADVPVGVYLSGGLDSSIVASIVARCTTARLRTFSVRFEDEELDETPFQNALVERLGTDHTAVLCRKADIGRAFPRAVLHAEAPLVRTAPTPLVLLAERVHAEGYKVVLTGEGADEVLAGYDLFKEAKIRRFCARQPASTARRALLRRLYPYLAASPVAAPAFAEAFFGRGADRIAEPFFGHLPRFDTTRRIARYFSPAFAERLAGFDPEEGLRRLVPSEAAAWPDLCRDQYVEAHTLLSGYILAAQGDRAAMAHAVEGRHPFLDPRVIQIANDLPFYWKMLGLREKHVLRRAFADLLPDEVLRRPKQPYRSPDAASFFAGGRPLGWVADLFRADRLTEAGYFAPTAARRLFAKCRAGRAVGFQDNMAFVGILSVMLLDELFVRGGALPEGRALEPVEDA